MKKADFFCLLWVAALLVFTLNLRSFGQDPPADKAPAAQNAPQQPKFTPEVEKFVAQMNEFKDKIKKLRSLKEEYQTATVERKDAIAAEYTPLRDETAVLQKALIPTAIAAYNSTEQKFEDIRLFLLQMFETSVIRSENYEMANTIAQTIFTNDDDLPEQLKYLYAYAAYAAFNVMDLEGAEKWIELAKKYNSFQEIQKYDTQNKMNLLSAISQLPEYKKLWVEEKAIREKEAADDNLPHVLLKTTKGDITIELFANEAPEAVGNFLTLVKDNFYTDVPFHRVLPYFMAQGGDPTGTGAGGPGYCIKCECRKPNARMHFRGSLSMAHAGPDTGGSQFFLTFVPTGFLNKKHTVFGRVIDGMDVLSELQRIDPEGENLPAPDKIIEAKILRGEPTPFEKLPGK